MQWKCKNCNKIKLIFIFYRYCNECKPKERVKTPKKKARQVFNEEDDEDGNNEDEDQQDEEEAGSSSDEVQSVPYGWDKF